MPSQSEVAVAALLHDLRALLKEVKVEVQPSLDQLLQRAEAAEVIPFLKHAEQYAAASTTFLPPSEPLQSIFSLIYLDQPLPAAHYHRLTRLPRTEESLDTLFPNTAPTEVNHAHLQNLAAALEAAAAKVADAHLYAHLLAILQRYGWCIPIHTNDLSLYDHAHLTSAITVCLHAYHGENATDALLTHAAKEETERDEQKEKKKRFRFALLVGDLSGIQDYIFDIATIGEGGVGRRLRARSFYLSAVADAISHYAARTFNVPLGNVIMASGGKFYLLLPNRDNVAEEVQALRAQIDAWFLKEFNGEIAVNLAVTTFPAAYFQASTAQTKGFGDVLIELERQLAREKSRRGLGTLVSTQVWNESAFVIAHTFDGQGECGSCHKFPAAEKGLCKQCARDQSLGSRLPSAQYLAYYRPEDLPQAKEVLPLPLGYGLRVITSGSPITDLGKPYLVVRLNDPEVSHLAAYPAGFRYLANHTPAGLTFEEIAKKANGRELLGYIKADVDYLGQLFAQGLWRAEGGRDTAAHIAALSRQLDVFFSGWIQHLLTTKPEYHEVYTVYSGGDDLFLVAPWDQALHLAQDIREEFARFTGQNPNLTLSAGIALAKSGYPIARAAHDADEALEAAKERPWLDEQGRARSRNQLTLLGQTLRWKHLPSMLKDMNTLERQGKKLKSAFLYDLIAFSQDHRRWREGGEPEGIRYRAQFAYQVARNLREKDSEIRRWADDLLQALDGQREDRWRYMGLAATWVLFGRREK